MPELLRNLFIGGRFYGLISGIALMFVAGYYFPALMFAANLAFLMVLALLLLDLMALFLFSGNIRVRREAPARMSNGDSNRILLHLENRYAYTVRLELIDEIPAQFQIRDFFHRVQLPSQSQRSISYLLRPTTRGAYLFRNINCYVLTRLGLAKRRFRFPQQQTVPVYPSFIQMRHFELLAISNRLTEAGIKKIRRVGRTLEFDQIRDYVSGDDYRTVNWKASARRHQLMVNNYQDERSQQVYNVINLGRVMKMPFENMTLLEYAINATLVLSNIAMHKHDKAGVVTFSKGVHGVLPAERRPNQITRLMEILYHLETDFLESDYHILAVELLQRLKQRSLVLLYTNFETLNSLQRQLPFLRRLARRHLLVVIFFDNTELRELAEKPARNTEEIYYQTIAQQFRFEKRQIVRELRQYGIEPILTAPQRLTVDTINTYLKLKARGMI